MDAIKVHAPASVSNVSCGYDIFGFAINGLGDEIKLKKRSDSKLNIVDIAGARLPNEPDKNVATVAISSLLRHIGSDQGFDIWIKKLTPPCSGLGSSASSASGAVFAASELLETGMTKMDLLPFALEGEEIASKKIHADNVAPAMLGGFNVIRSNVPEVDVFQINYPKSLKVLVVYPNVEISTLEATQLLGDTLALDKAVQQWGNVAGLVAGLINEDWGLIGRSMIDVVAEPLRKAQIPNYDQVKKYVLGKGVVGFNISGSGPAMFALLKDGIADEVIQELESIYRKQAIECKVFVSEINQVGAQQTE